MGNNARLEKLLQPGKIGNMEIRNRIVMPAMGGMGPTEEGYVTEITKGFYETRARGGVGMIIIGNTPVSWQYGRTGRFRIINEDDRFLPGLTQVAEVIRKHGARAAVQINHAGPSAYLSDPKLVPIASSAVSRPPDHLRSTYPVPREMSVGEVEEMVGKYAAAAGRAKRAGFEGIEIHSAHRYLVNSFISPYFNKRQDKYGGDLKGRATFLLEIIAATRQAVGNDFPVWCRINGIENGVPGGITPDLARGLAQLLEKTGQINGVHVTQWLPMLMDPPGYALERAAYVKKGVSFPVIAVGLIDPIMGEAALRAGKADFIAMGRELISDPELPNKVKEGRLDEINPCQRCNNCEALCECTVNAAYLRDYEYELKPAAKPRKVMVVGGGPGGMEAARIAALRGHQVTLYEKERRLGGQLALASIIRTRGEALTNYFTAQMRARGVKVELGKGVDAALVKESKPDVVVVATGCTSALPDIPGNKKEIVLSSSDIGEMMHGRPSGKSLRRRLWYTGILFMRVFGPGAMRRVLRVWAPFGDRVIVMGLRLHSVEIAHFMAERGKKVTLVDTAQALPPRITCVNSGDKSAERPMPHLRLKFLEDLHEMGVPILLSVKYVEITDKGLVILDKEGKRQTLEADTIVCASDYSPDARLAKELSGSGVEVHLVGDCRQPVGILEAIHDGAKVAREI